MNLTTTDRIVAAIMEDAEKKEKHFIDMQELSVKKRNVVKKLVEIQKELRQLDTKVQSMKTDKGELSDDVMQALEELHADGVRVGELIVSISHTTTPPSFDAVLEAVKNDLEPTVTALLNATYKNLTKAGKDYLRFTKNSESKVNENILQDIVDFFKNLFVPGVKKITGAIDKIESILHMN